MVFVSTPLTGAVRDALAAWGVAGDAPAQRLYGGEESAAYRLGEHVVRVGPLERDTSVTEWCHDVATAAAMSVPEAVAPLRTSAGASVRVVEGRPVSVWPFVGGAWPEEGTDGMATQAARLLARLHRALAATDPPPRPVRSFLEVGADGSGDADAPGAVDPSLDRWLAEFHRRGPACHPVHGDFYAGNTLASDGRIVALLDWDEACVLPPEFEVATAALEWTDELDGDVAVLRVFAGHYAEAGGSAGRMEDEALVQLVRHRLRREAAYYELAVSRGVLHDDEDVEYHRQRLRMFHLLRP